MSVFSQAVRFMDAFDEWVNFWNNVDVVNQLKLTFPCSSCCKVGPLIIGRFFLLGFFPYWCLLDFKKIV